MVADKDMRLTHVALELREALEDLLMTMQDARDTAGNRTLIIPGPTTFWYAYDRAKSLVEPEPIGRCGLTGKDLQLNCPCPAWHECKA